ncbi:InlB B-repeat-containing protein [Anaerobiospirillum succiniciproducens]|uniref:InlB B-repeat-containing protein n=1 Tax=Anaerobiospirillum succiniciproducens TaxID=13335 RepID=UPI003F89AFE7
MKTITFNVDGGSAVPNMTIGSGTLLDHSKIVLPTKEGYSFGGWFNYNFTQAFDFNQPIVQDTTLYVKWNKL